MKSIKKWWLGLLSLIVAALVLATAIPAHSDVGSDCKFDGISLYGDVKIVSSSGDIKVKFVSSFPDLNVKFVSSFPDSCGKWKIVDSFPDFTIEKVSSFPDITVKEVSSFPGLP
ncbi:MAG: hypothetical protein AAF685_10255 [Cyanobacteria bacterium P01_C01_bin.89]